MVRETTLVTGTDPDARHEAIRLNVVAGSIAASEAHPGR